MAGITITDPQALSVAMARIQNTVASLLDACHSLSRQVELIYNAEMSNAANIAAVSERLDDVEAIVTDTQTTVDGIPVTEYTPTLEGIIATQEQIITQLNNIENAIAAIPDAQRFQNMTEQLDSIHAAIGYPPPGQDIWSRITTIINVTTGQETTKVRCYGSVVGLPACDVYVNVYDCLSNNRVANTVVDKTTGTFQVYLIPGRYVIELVGSEISTKSLTVDVPTNVTEYNLTP
jgi:hypothetical protein